MMSVISKFSVLQELWGQAADIVHDTETGAVIRGVATHMQSFDFFFGLVLGEMLLCHTHNLSRTLQGKCPAFAGHKVPKMTRMTLLSMSNEENFDLFWMKVGKMKEDVGVGEPVLPRRRKVPKRFEDGATPAKFPSSSKELFRWYTLKQLTCLCKQSMIVCVCLFKKGASLHSMMIVLINPPTKPIALWKTWSSKHCERRITQMS